jgi:hypothetical protein
MGHIGWEQPTHKSAYRNRGSATAEEVLTRPGSRVRCAFGSAEDCRYDKLDKSNSFTPGKLQEKHTRCLAGKASSICGKLICRVEYRVWALLGAQLNSKDRGAVWLTIRTNTR